MSIANSSVFYQGYISKFKQAEIDEKGKANPYSKGVQIQVGRMGKEDYRPRMVTVENPYYVEPPSLVDQAVAAAEKKNEEFKKSQEEIFQAQQQDIADQLKIVQEEKSAVSKLSQEYSDMLIAEAERKKQAEEDARIALRTDRANLARAGQRGSLLIQPAGSTPRATAGTQQFRRRAVQFGGATTGTPYTGLSRISSGMVNV